MFKQFENYEIRICCPQSWLTLYSPMDGLEPASLLRPWDFSRQEYWSRLPFLPLEELPNAGIEPTSPVSPTSAGRFFITEPLGKPQVKNIFIQMSSQFVAHLKLMLCQLQSNKNKKEYPMPKSLKRVGLFIFMQTAVSSSTRCYLYGWIASGNTESYVMSQIISLSFFWVQLVCS